ncbi:hypothetical protein Bca4012_018527 [Brassica carinata]
MTELEKIPITEKLSRTEKTSSYDGKYSEISSGLPKGEANNGAVTLYTASEEAEQHLENVKNVENLENVASPVGSRAICQYVEVLLVVEEIRRVVKWEDGMGRNGKEPIGVPGFRKMPGRPKQRELYQHMSPLQSLIEQLVVEGLSLVVIANMLDITKGLVDGESYPFPPPKRQRTTKSQATISVPQSQPASSTALGATSTFPTSSSAPPASASSSAPPTSATGRRRGRPPGRGQGRPPVRRQPSIPRGVGIYTCPFTDRVFDVRGSRARELGQSQRPRQL